MSALPFLDTLCRQAVAHEARRGTAAGMAEVMRTPAFYYATLPTRQDNAVAAARRGDLDRAERDVIAMMDAARRLA